MLERLMAVSLRNRLLVGLGLVLVVAIGTWSISTIPIDAFPDVTNIQVEVISTAPGLSPLEIERVVTYPLETAMRGLPGLVTMRSSTKYGIAVVTVVFRDDTDIYFARQQVHERVSDVSRSLPEGVETVMGPIATAMGEIYQYTLEQAAGEAPAAADDRSPEGVRRLMRLRTLQDWVVSPMLKGVPGVTEVNSFGGYIQQFEVLVDPDRLLKYGLSVEGVRLAIQRNNANVGGSIVTRGSEEYIIRGVGMIQSEGDIRSIVLKSEAGTAVTIGDVADVRTGHAVRQGASLKDGRGESVGGIVLMLRGENSRDVVAALEEKVREINESRVLPDSVRLVPFYRRSPVVEASMRTVLKALAEGSVLVVAVLLLLLRSARGAFVVIVALPLSILLTFTVLKVARIDANLMSLGGLAISIGMIIDATIIQVENIQRRLGQKGGHGGNSSLKERMATVLAAAVEVRQPSILGELIIALTFVPIITLQGLEGKMFSPLAFTVALALMASLLLSIFVIPVLCLAVLKPEHRESPVLRTIRRLYLPSLRWTLGHRVTVVVAGGALVFGALALVPRLGTEFLPIMDEGAFDMDVQLLPGVSLDKALETTLEVEKRLMKFPELQTVVSRTGQTGVAIEARGVDKTGFVGALKSRSEWTSADSREELADKMRDAVADIPGMVASFSQPIQCRIDELVAGTRAQVIVKLFGDDLRVLKQKAGEMARVLSEVRGVEDLSEEKVAGQPYLTVSVDRERIARYGVNASDVLDLIETAVGGKTVSQVYLQNQVTDVAIRLSDEHRGSVEALSGLLVDAPGGARLPLSQLARVEVQEGPAQISREDGRRRIGVEMNVAGRDIGSFVAEAQSRLRAEVAVPAGYYLQWGGQFENQQQAMRRLGVIAPAVAVLIFVLLLVTFGSLRAAGLVIFNLPFALAGGVFALWLSGLYLSVPASVGFIVLFGVAVLNGVVLISAIAQLRAAGMPTADAVVTGCDSRLRPVLMTAAIAVFSLLPMVVATGPGAEVQRPLAVVVVGGLITSTVLTLLVLPVLYRWVERD